MPADLQRLHKYMLEIESIDHISDEMRAVVESEWPELVHKPPPKKLQGRLPPQLRSLAAGFAGPAPTALRIGIQVRAARRQHKRLDPA
jgi:hypothetical protein